MPEAFESFLVLAIIAVVVAAVLHYGLKFYAEPGTSSFLSKTVVAYIGALLGTPLFGAWFDAVAWAGVYIIPAILGSLALVVLAVDVARIIKR